MLLGTSHDKSSLDGPNLTGFNLTIAKSLQSESLTKYEEKKSGPLEETDTSKPEEHIEEGKFCNTRSLQLIALEKCLHERCD